VRHTIAAGSETNERTLHKRTLHKPYTSHTHLNTHTNSPTRSTASVELVLGQAQCVGWTQQAPEARLYVGCVNTAAVVSHVSAGH
jgi:hypothetical protein